MVSKKTPLSEMAQISPSDFIKFELTEAWFNPVWYNSVNPNPCVNDCWRVTEVTVDAEGKHYLRENGHQFFISENGNTPPLWIEVYPPKELEPEMPHVQKISQIFYANMPEKTPEEELAAAKLRIQAFESAVAEALDRMPMFLEYYPQWKDIRRKLTTAWLSD